MNMLRIISKVPVKTRLCNRFPASLLNYSSSTSSTGGVLPENATVAIIGGGAVGTSVAYHLSKQGCPGVVLLEMSSLTAGSTWHAAGLVTSYHPLPNMKRLHQYSLGLFSQLEQETGQAIGLHSPGSIRVTTSDERAQELRYLVSRRSVGTPMCLLSPEQIAKYCPLVDKDKVKLGLYTHGDGYLDPYSLTQAYAKAATRYGAKIYQDVRVTGLSQEANGRWKVDTSKGSVSVGHVVNAAGYHGKEVAAMAGHHVPLVAVEHQYMVTGAMAAVRRLSRETPVLRPLDASSYIRIEGDGLLVGVFEAPGIMKIREEWLKNGVPEDFSRQLFEPDLERLEPYLAQVMDLIPSLKTGEIKSVVSGPITYSPDGLPLLGPYMMQGMWLALCFSYGIIHSAGAGKYLADYIMTGEPPCDLTELDPGRFSDTWLTEDCQLAKTREAYGLNNAVGYPYEERFAGRPTKRVSSAHSAQVGRGASFLPQGGWEQPSWFAGVDQTAEYKPAFTRTNWHTATIREVRRVMEAAGIIDLTSSGKFIVSGEGAAELLNRTTANSLPETGGCCVTHALTSLGTVYAEWTVAATEQGAFLVVTGARSEIPDLRWLQTKARKWALSKVDIANVTEDFGCLGLAGPKARDVLCAASPDFPPHFPPSSVRKVTVFGVASNALSVSSTGEEGWELYHPRDHTGKLYSALLEVGARFGLGDCGSHALSTLRQEKGARSWGAELTLDGTLEEARLTHCIDWNKGEFEGRAAALAQHQRLPERLLVQVKLDSPKLDPVGGEAVWSCGTVVGNTTSGCYSPHLGQSLAFCYLPPFLATPGIKVQVEILNELHEAIVLPGPAVKSFYGN